MSSTTTKSVLRKVTKAKDLTEEEKKVLKKFVAVLKKVLKGKSLSADNRRQIKNIVEKSKAGTLTASDIINLGSNLFQLWNIFKDYT